MVSATFYMQKIVRLESLGMITGNRIKDVLNRLWDVLRPVVRRVYIFFATPKTMIAVADPPYFIPEKSEFRILTDTILFRIKAGIKSFQR